ncbi:E3 ubiquitin-protein ligase RNF126-like [Microplitis mediator]|uniref:E3 ubiquitin-protein ligase RNF126-like n=1 Tax=Microplitis mediator TaxID=375433 RepID=UPI0025538710|nr:E3 ubiquitin-protein ligase RNF126-like [Microplitis mediator]
MTYPGMAFVFVVGVGLATILYYMFADNSHNQHNHSNNGTGPPPDIPQNSWSAPTARQRSRRKGSGASTDKTNCTICLAEISLPQIVNVRPCGHAFHMKCIQDWQKQGQTESHKSCPNCRRKIEEIC